MEEVINSTLEWMKDIYPDGHKYITFLKKVFRHEFRKNWFRRISTPIIERKEFAKKAYLEDESLLSNLYIVNNEEELFLQKDAIISIMRSYINNNLDEQIQPLYFYYMERFFCNSCVNKESIKIWCEIIWEKDPILEAQLAFIAFSSLKKIWLWNNIKIKINTLWNDKEMVKYKEELSNFYENKKHLLSEESLKLLEEGRLLDLMSSENEDEVILAKQTTPIIKFLKKDSKTHYSKFKEYLELLDLEYEEDKLLFFKENYYSSVMWLLEDTDTWEILASWWRYNDLAKRLWSEKDIPATGFSIDTEVIIDKLINEKIKIKNKDKLDLYFVQLWDEAKKVVLPLSLDARKAWVNTMVSLWTPSLKEQMLKASRIWAKYVVLVWIMEARNWIFQVRDLEAWTQEEVKKEEIIDYIIGKIWKDNLDFYSPARDLIKE